MKKKPTKEQMERARKMAERDIILFPAWKREAMARSNEAKEHQERGYRDAKGKRI